MAHPMSLTKNIRLGGPKSSIDKSRQLLQSKYTKGVPTTKVVGHDQVCRYYLQDFCKRGNKCRYVHNSSLRDELIGELEAKLRNAGVVNPSEYCLLYSTGEKCKKSERGMACSKKHDLPIRQKVINPRSSTAKADYATAARGSIAVETLTNKISNFTINVTTSAKVSTDVKATNSSKVKVSPKINGSSKGNNSPKPNTSQVGACKSKAMTKFDHTFGVTNPGRPNDWALEGLAPCAREKSQWEVSGERDRAVEGVFKKDFRATADFNTNFHRFGELPRELRDIIWKLVLKAEVCDARVKLTGASTSQWMENTRFEPQNPTPRLLHVCRESRALALTKYKKAWRTFYHRGTQYFNFHSDRLFLHTNHSGQYKDIEEHIDIAAVHHTRHLALPLRDFIVGNDKQIARFVLSFTNLRTFTLMAGDIAEDREIVNLEKCITGIKKMLHSYWNAHKLFPQWKGRRHPEIKVEWYSEEKARLYKLGGFKW